MFWKKKKVSARRQRIRDNISAERFSRISEIVNSRFPAATAVLVVFIAAATAILSVDTSNGMIFSGGTIFRSTQEILAIGSIVILICLGAAIYAHHYQNRVILKPARTIALAGLLLILLALTRIGSLYLSCLAVGPAVTCAIILTITYDQRFALGMSLFYSVLACFAAGGIITVDKAASLNYTAMISKIETFELFITMMAGVVTCCFSLREIRTRMKLIEVSVLASTTVFVMATAIGLIRGLPMGKVFSNAGAAAIITVAVGVVIQGFLPLIEKVFGVATSMTLMDYSDANQPLLKKLAMEAPGTFSHSLLIGSIAEVAAESIGANGLLCRVGAYYHDIGKINKPGYFVENQMGSTSRHEQLSPTMSQLIIVGHVKDGVEIAKEYGLPAVLRQFIETHHGTTLVEYFFHEAKKQQDEKQTAVSETEFRYSGPKPKTKEAAIVMLADGSEGAVRSLSDPAPTKIEVIIHNIAMKRLRDGQFDECDLTLRELSQIEINLSKSLAAHHHGRISYPSQTEQAEEDQQTN